MKSESTSDLRISASLVVVVVGGGGGGGEDLQELYVQYVEVCIIMLSYVPLEETGV